MSLHARYLQQAAWTRDLRAYLFDRVEWRSARRLLEVGCGTGVILQELETASTGLGPGSPEMFGVDLSNAALSESRRHTSRAKLIQADARALPFPDRTFDITFCHFLLLWMDDPFAALHEMARVTRDHMLALAEPDYSRRVDAPAQLIGLGRLQNEALRRQGADVNIGSRLAELFDRLGLQIRETGVIEPWTSQQMAGGHMQAEWDTLEADLGDIVSFEEMDRFRQLDAHAREQGIRQLYVPTYFAWGQV